MPYVARLLLNGRGLPSDTFFDTFIFIDLVSQLPGDRLRHPGNRRRFAAAPGEPPAGDTDDCDVDSVIERWEALAPQHLRLAGFYWLQEHVNPAVPDELDMVRRTARYIHDLGLKLGWIPWSGAYLATQWRSFGFDWAVTQPNHLFHDEEGLIEKALAHVPSQRTWGSK